MRRLAASIAIIVCLGAPSYALAANTVARSPEDPGQLQLTVASSVGEARDLLVTQNGAGVEIAPDPEITTRPPETWVISAPDCENSQGGGVFCSLPVTSLAFVGGDGNELINAIKVPFPLIFSSGGGDDWVLGGDGDDIGDLGIGDDHFDGGAGDDRATGGDGDDEVFGGEGSDRLTGAAGADRLFGESGVDRLFARDHERDRRLDCGPGSGEKERAKVDRSDPPAKSC